MQHYLLNNPGLVIAEVVANNIEIAFKFLY